VIAVLEYAREVIQVVALTLVDLRNEVKDALLARLSLNVHLREAILAAESFRNNDLVELADGAGEARVPNEEESALVGARVLIKLRDDLGIVVYLTVAFRVALIPHMASITALWIRKALITVLVDDLKSAAANTIKWAHFEELAAKVLKHSVAAQICQMCDRVQIRLRVPVGAQVGLTIDL